MNIYQNQEEAKNILVDAIRGTKFGFRAHFPTGVILLLWLDPYMGLIEIPGRSGFFLARDIDEEFPALDTDAPIAVTSDEIEGLTFLNELLLKTAENQ